MINELYDKIKDPYKKIVFSRASQILIDIVLFFLAYIVAFLIRYEGIPTGLSLSQMLSLLPYFVLARTLCFAIFPVYRIIWRFVSIFDVFTILSALLPPTVIALLGRLLLPDSLMMLRLPLSIISMELSFTLVGTLAVRMLWRSYTETLRRDRLRDQAGPDHRTKTLLIGAGRAGNMVAKELNERADLGVEVVGFVDDDPKQRRKRIQGIPVLGDTTKIPMIAKKLCVEEAIITIANASSKEIRRISEPCQQAGLKIKIVPGLFEMLDTRITITKVREIKIDDLLGRSVFDLEKHFDEVSSVYRGKRVLVTGAGGSIGSELCRQLASMGSREIVLLDKDENGVFEIDNELRARGLDGVRILPVIANVVNESRLRSLFAKFRPEIVFHAAAHKHVPLMEFNVTEAVMNNIGGTKNLVDISAESGVERFIFISTDKAVRPTNIMGATKKVGEVIVQGAARGNGTKFACVRFGNVVGSRGSVIPIFQQQIAKGGPVTVTHPDVRRYFMSIPEAVHLIIQAGTLGEKGQIFVLDMGQPIKIVDMVKTLIRLSGHREDDIEIKFVGMRPGEKMFEEILIDEEMTKATKFEKIYIAPPMDDLNGRAGAEVANLLRAASIGDGAQVIERFSALGIGFQRGSRL
jgi:FlaA1/EpsC-like NDP-sugar epimerase